MKKNLKVEFYYMPIYSLHVYSVYTRYMRAIADFPYVRISTYACEPHKYVVRVT